MGKKCAGVILILAAFVACAGGSESVPPVSAVAVPAVALPLGQLHVEPYEIVFTRQATGTQTIRVWQSGWRGHYKMTTDCNLVAVTLQKYGRAKRLALGCRSHGPGEGALSRHVLRKPRSKGDQLRRDKGSPTQIARRTK